MTAAPGSAQQPVPLRTSSMLALAAMIMSIAALAAAVVIPVLGAGAGIAGAMCGGIALSRHPSSQDRRRALFGVIGGVAAVVLSVAVALILFRLFSAVFP